MSKNKKGFTLIELLVGLAIVMVVLFAFFRTTNTTIRINTKNDRDIKALNICQSEVENIRNNIKRNDEYIVIDTEDEIKEIKIPIKNGNEDIQWISESNEEIEKINIISKKYEDNIYQSENGNKDNSRLEYQKKYSDGNVYNIVLGIKRKIIHREKEIYLYDIDILAKLNEKYFTEKNTTLKTSILTKEDIVVSVEDSENPNPDIFSGTNYVRFYKSTGNKDYGMFYIGSYKGRDSSGVPIGNTPKSIPDKQVGESLEIIYSNQNKKEPKIEIKRLLNGDILYESNWDPINPYNQLDYVHIATNSYVGELKSDAIIKNIIIKADGSEIYKSKDNLIVSNGGDNMNSIDIFIGDKTENIDKVSITFDVMINNNGHFEVIFLDKKEGN